MKKIILLLAFIAIIFALKYFGIADYLTLENIKANKELIIRLSTEKTALFVLGFIITYIVVVLFQIPGATILTLTGGAVFGAWFGTLWVNIGASIGALLAFLLARYILQDMVNQRFGEKLTEFNKGITKNGFNYILFLRLVPLFPFFLINMLSGITSIKTKDYFFATMIGIIPGSFVYCNVASALWEVNSISDLVSGKIFISFGLLGLLALVPIIHKKIKTKKEAA
ncbi:TVP38/TMEM64 family protein [Candidatus Margulisiibacteriota bacterium]